MLTVKKTEDMEQMRAFLQEQMPETEPCIFMETYDDGVRAAVGWLALKGYRTYLDGVVCAPGMESLTLVTAKALLNYADLHRIETIYGDNPALDKLYRMLRFQQEDSVWKLSLQGYFTAEHA